MSKTVKSLALVSALGLAALAVASTTMVVQNWDKLTSNRSHSEEGKEIEFEPNSFSNTKSDRPLVNAKELKEDKKDLPSGNVVNIHGLSIELLNCISQPISANVQTISCPYLVTSQQPQARLEMSSGKNYNPAQVRFIDAQGREYISTRIRFGADINNYRVTKDLIKDIPIRGTVIFDNIPTSIADIKVLELYGNLNSQLYRGNVKVQFREVNLSSSTI
ncbi:MAG: hypothetical protein ACFBSE_20260 [Prochloraceae cyanobacterium]